jgi:hypothetical protein
MSHSEHFPHSEPAFSGQQTQIRIVRNLVKVTALGFLAQGLVKGILNTLHFEPQASASQLPDIQMQTSMQTSFGT